MRMLHTADWHLGRMLEGRERRVEQEAFVDELCQIAEERQVELVLIAGDIYDSVNPPAWAEELFYRALERLSAEGKRGVVVIAGNHDQPERVRAASPLAHKQGIVLLGLPKEAPYVSQPDTPTDRVRVVDGGPSWFEIAVPGVAHTAVIVALPYPSEARLKELISESFTPEQMQQAFSERIATLLHELSSKFRDDTVNLITSHLFVMGGKETDSERPIQIGGTHVVTPSAFPKSAHYVALGHLHRLQKRGDAPLIRYSGSPLAYSFSEEGHSKAVVLVDIQPNTNAANAHTSIEQEQQVQEEIIYLTSGRPLVRWQATGGIAEVEQWLAAGRDAGSWIDLEIHVSDVIDPAEFQRIRKLSEDFVKVQRVLVKTDDSEATDDTEQVKRDQMSPEQLFRRFYERKRGTEPDQKIIELFSRLMVGVDMGTETEEESGGETA